MRGNEEGQGGRRGKRENGAPLPKKKSFSSSFSGQMRKIFCYTRYQLCGIKFFGSNECLDDKISYLWIKECAFFFIWPL